MKYLFLLTVILFCDTISFAQLKLGPTAGFQLASQYIEYRGNGNTGTSAGYAPNYRVGVAAEFPFNKNLHLQTALVITGKGRSYNGKTLLKLTYLELPLLMTADFKTIGKTRVFIGAGPYLGYGLSAYFKGLEELDVFKGKFYYPFDWGIGAVIGLRINKQWVSSINYTLGLKQMRNKDNIIIYDDNIEKNTTIHISLTYLIQVSDR